MYVVVVYDADSLERENIRAILMPSLHWIQASVFAGELTKVAADDLRSSLERNVKNAKVVFWLFDRPPNISHIGTQEDRESIFL